MSSSPPGQIRSYPEPTKTGKISFIYEKIDQPCETAYSIYGDLKSTKTALICLHGGPGIPGRYFKPLALLNHDLGIPIVLYDQIGCGDSTHLRHTHGDTNLWTYDIFVAELYNLIDKLGIEQYDLIGHSWGGMLGTKFAFTHPRGLRKLIVHSTPASVDHRARVTLRQRAELPGNMPQIIEAAERAGNTDDPEYKNAMNVWYNRHMCRLDPWPKEMVDSMAGAASDQTVYLTMYGKSHVYLTGTCKGFDITEDLAQITPANVPGGMLLINGKYDAAQDEVMMPFFIKPSTRVKWIRFAESGHMSMLEETEAYLAAVGTFLEAE